MIEFDVDSDDDDSQAATRNADTCLTALQAIVGEQGVELLPPGTWRIDTPTETSTQLPAASASLIRLSYDAAMASELLAKLPQALASAVQQQQQHQLVNGR